MQDPPTFQELTSEQREEIDSRAMALGPEAARDRSRERFRDLKSWLTQRAPMPPSIELERIRETHARVLSSHASVTRSRTVADVLGRLNAALPEVIVAEVGPFEVFVLDRSGWLSASGGWNLLYVSTETVELTAGPSQSDRIAFLLARQIAASCLGHCRCWYQAEWTASFAERSDVSLISIAPTGGDDLLRTVLGREGAVSELFAEDLFALHLCRIAGFIVDAVLDVPRSEVQAELGGAVIGLTEGDRPVQAGIGLRRLRRLLAELNGTVSGDEYGLCQWVARRWEPLPDNALAGVDRAVLVVHGLASSLRTFDKMLTKLLRDQRRESVVLGFCYPETGSLYRSSKFLLNELTRVGAMTAGFDFVCHSAGGLVFRRAVELDGLEFRTATLIGTPNTGSDLASLRPLVEAQQFFGSLRSGFSQSVAAATEDNTTQMVRDLEPSSLFLAEMNSIATRDSGSRYRIVRGHALTTQNALLLALGIGAARAALRKLALSKLAEHQTAAAINWINRLQVPEEVSKGDMAVTLTSATLAGATDVLTVPTSHSKLPQDLRVIEFIQSATNEDPSKSIL